MCMQVGLHVRGCVPFAQVGLEKFDCDSQSLFIAPPVRVSLVCHYVRYGINALCKISLKC